jgi:hypothetical protein
VCIAGALCAWEACGNIVQTGVQPPIFLQVGACCSRLSCLSHRTQDNTQGTDLGGLPASPSNRQSFHRLQQLLPHFLVAEKHSTHSSGKSLAALPAASNSASPVPPPNLYGPYATCFFPDHPAISNSPDSALSIASASAGLSKSTEVPPTSYPSAQSSTSLTARPLQAPWPCYSCFLIPPCNRKHDSRQAVADSLQTPPTYGRFARAFHELTAAHTVARHV